jgi:dipeptidyl aminopeptidase/acylaminoacyl peptidase
MVRSCGRRIRLELRGTVVHWKSDDGTEIEDLLTYPVDYRPGTRVPLLLVIHGGPSGVHLQSFLPYPGSAYPLAVFAS